MKNTEIYTSGYVSEVYGRQTIVEVWESELGEITEGYEGIKHFRKVCVKKNGKTRPAGIMVEKSGYREPPIEVLKKYNILNSAFRKAVREGVFPYNPLPKTLRLREDKNSLLISDFTEGEKFYILDRHTPPGSLGINLNDTQLAQIEKTAIQIAEIALAAGVVLDTDAYNVLYPTDANLSGGEIQIRVGLLDIGLLSYTTRVTPDSDEYKYYQNISKKRISGFIYNLNMSAGVEEFS